MFIRLFDEWTTFIRVLLWNLGAEIKSDFYVALKVQLEIFSSFFFPFFKSLLTFFLRAKRVCTVRVFFFFFSFYIGMLRESVWEVARCGWKCFWKKNCIALLISIFSGTFSPRHGKVTRFFFSRESVEVKKVGKCHVSKHFFTFTLFIIQSIE